MRWGKETKTLLIYGTRERETVLHNTPMVEKIKVRIPHRNNSREQILLWRPSPNRFCSCSIPTKQRPYYGKIQSFPPPYQHENHCALWNLLRLKSTGQNLWLNQWTGYHLKKLSLKVKNNKTQDVYGVSWKTLSISHKRLEI